MGGQEGSVEDLGLGIKGNQSPEQSLTKTTKQ